METKLTDPPRKNSNWDLVKNLLPKIVTNGKKSNKLPPLEVTTNGHVNQTHLPPINT